MVDSREWWKASAAGYARVVSRKLRQGGFLMSNKTTKQWTEGFSVSRVGFSSQIAIHYHIPYWGHKTSSGKSAKEMVAEAIAYMRNKGYRFDDRGWLDAEKHA